MSCSSVQMFGSAAKPESPFHSMMAIVSDMFVHRTCTIYIVFLCTRKFISCVVVLQVAGSSLSYHSHTAVLLQV